MLSCFRSLKQRNITGKLRNSLFTQCNYRGYYVNMLHHVSSVRMCFTANEVSKGNKTSLVTFYILLSTRHSLSGVIVSVSSLNHRSDQNLISHNSTNTLSRKGDGNNDNQQCYFVLIYHQILRSC